MPTPTPGARTLLTGPYGAASAIRARLLASGKVGPRDLWLVPSPAAAARTSHWLGSSSPGVLAPRVWCWDDLWRTVRETRDDGPVWLSDAAARAVLGQAVEQARAAGELGDSARVAHWPGFQRRLRGRIAAWTQREFDLDVDVERSSPDDPEAAVYRRYRTLLRTLDAEDADGIATWASFALAAKLPSELTRLGVLTVLDPEEPGPAVRRALRALESVAKAVRITLPYDAEPASREVYGRLEPLRRSLLEQGYVETVVPPDDARPAALASLESTLFRDDAHRLPRIESTAGVRLIGAPQGDGLGLFVAREVRRRLEAGFAPEDLLVLVRRWDEDAEVVLEALRAWGLPVAAPDRPRRLATESSVSAVRLALALPVDRWEASAVVRLLRHGRFRPDWEEYRSPTLAARAAGAIRDARVFRGPEALRHAVGRLKPSGEALALLERLLDEVGSIDRPGPWSDHVGRLRRLSRTLGIDRAETRDDALEHFWLALDDHADVLTGIGRGRESIPFRTFAREVEATARDLAFPADDDRPGSVSMTTVDAAAGASARCLLLVNLAEGTFPTPDAVAQGSNSGAGGGGVDRAYARELARFLRVVGSADEELVLVHPTRDEKGQEVLAAGFLDDLRRRFAPEALAAVSEVHNRLDPALMDHPELAVAPGEARVQAVALACLRDDVAPLRRLARDPRHRGPLQGAAIALALGEARFRRREFTRFDGRLSDPRLIASLADHFGPEFTFSPSQLESYLYCPFQFFMKFALGLIPIEDRDELEEDYAGRGERVHNSLEELERLRLQRGGDRLELVEIVIETAMRAELSIGSEADPGLHAIEGRRLERTLRGYVSQAAADVEESKAKGPVPVPSHFEVAFGDQKRDDSLPTLEVGRGSTRVKVRGKIDRVDVVDSGGALGFRVIDYKTGPCPTSKEVKEFQMVQLPLYALAVERHLLVEHHAAFEELGYWELRDKGYRPIKRIEWTSFRDELEDRVVEAVERLREGRFEVRPRSDHCTSHCDYAAVCRVGQVRATRKFAAEAEAEAGEGEPR